MTQARGYSPILLPIVLLLAGLWIIHIMVRGEQVAGNAVRLTLLAALAITLVAFVFAWWQTMTRLDEFERRIHWEALMLAFPVAFIGLFLIGFLRAEGFFSTLDSRDLPLVMVGSYLLGLFRARRRYR